MKINREHHLDKIMEIVKSLGISDSLIQELELYLEDEETKELGEALQKRFPKLDLSKQPRKIIDSALDTFRVLQRRNVKGYAGKYVAILYAIGGTTAKHLLIGTYCNISCIKTLLDDGIEKYQAISMVTEGMVYNTYNLTWERIKEILGYVNREEEILRKAMKGAKYNEANNFIYLAAIFFVLLREKGIWKADKTLSDSAITENMFYEKNGLSEQDKKEFKWYEDNIIASIDVTYGVTLTEQQEVLMEEYMKKNVDYQKPAPTEIVDILKRGKQNDYLVTLLVGVSFLNIECSNILRNMIHLAITISGTKILDILYRISSPKHFHMYTSVLDNMFLIPEEDYILWTASINKHDGDLVLLERYKNSREIYIEVMKSAEIPVVKRMIYIIKQVKTDDKIEGIAEIRHQMQSKIIEAVGNRHPKFFHQMTGYLNGAMSIEDFILEVEFEKGGDSYYFSQEGSMLLDYKECMGEDDFYKRMIAYMALENTGAFFLRGILGYNNYGEKESKKMEELCYIFETQRVPLFYQIQLFSTLIEGTYNGKNSEMLKEMMKKPLRFFIEERREELLEAYKKLTPTGRCEILINFIETDDKNTDVLLSFFNDTSKQVKEILVNILKERKDIDVNILEKLSSKKSGEREIAILILSNWKEEKYQLALKKALEVEKSQKLTTLLQKELSILSQEDGEKNAIQGREEYVKSLLKGNRKRSLDWLYDTPFTKVHNLNKEERNEEYMRAFLLSYSTMDHLGTNKMVSVLTDDLEQRELEVFVGEVFDKWMEKGAEAKKKWVLYMAAIHGGTEMVQKLNHAINEWPKNARGAMAAEAIRALALNATPTALLIVDSISRKFKFKQVKGAAVQALSFAAKELGITTEELADKIVPNLGFEENFERIFDYGARSFRVCITPSMELEIYDDKNKKIKNLPSPGVKDDEEKAKIAYEAFKQMKKQMKTTIATQKLRLELALSTERKWSPEAWEALFVKNPIMHQFAISLIWGAYQDGKLTHTFRYMEDGTFNTHDEEEYELESESKIGLVHPLELSQELITAWKEQLSDYEITASIEQLDRSVYLMTEEEKEETELLRFGGIVINSLTLSGKLLSGGWYRGSVQDGGGYYTFYKEDMMQKIGVELEFSGSFVGYDQEDVTIYEVRFYQAETVQRGSYIYDTIKPENTYQLKDVPKKFFSETIYQLTKILASGRLEDKNWREEKR